MCLSSIYRDQPNLNRRVEDEEEDVGSVENAMESDLGQDEEVFEVVEDLQNEDWTLYSMWNDYTDGFPKSLEEVQIPKRILTFIREVTPKVTELFPNFPVRLFNKDLMVLMVLDVVRHDGEETLEVEVRKVTFRRPGAAPAQRNAPANLTLRVQGKLAQVFYLTLQFADLLVLDSEILHDVGDNVMDLDLQNYLESATILRLVALNEDRLENFNLGEKIHPKIKTNEDVHLPKVPFHFQYALTFQEEGSRIGITRRLPHKYYQLHEKKYGRQNGIFPVIANPTYSTSLGYVADAILTFGIRKERKQNIAKGPLKPIKEFAGKPWTFWLKNLILAMTTFYTILVVLCL